jgi:hypothetical protein
MCARTSASGGDLFKFVDVLSTLSIFPFIGPAMTESAKHPPRFPLRLCGTFLAGVKGLVIFPDSVTSVDVSPQYP